MKFCDNPKCEHHKNETDAPFLYVAIPQNPKLDEASSIHFLTATFQTEKILNHQFTIAITKPVCFYFCDKCKEKVEKAHRELDFLMNFNTDEFIRLMQNSDENDKLIHPLINLIKD